MPVGTRAAVRAVGPGELRAVGTDIVLANAFHLMLRPGDEVIAGLAGCTGSWDGTAPSSPIRAGFRCSR